MEMIKWDKIPYKFRIFRFSFKVIDQTNEGGVQHDLLLSMGGHAVA
jgi:hypothetical protein